MKLIFALGNPGTNYRHNRHNSGFMCVDWLAHEWSASFKEASKFKAYVAETSRGGEKILLVKPTTFYNLAGESAAALIRFYKLDPQDLLVIHDDIDLPFGTLRTRLGGSGGGSNGIASLNQHVGNDYYRIRVGVANDLRAQTDAAAFVLANFSRDEYEHLHEHAWPHIQKLADEFVLTGELQPHTINTQQN